MSSRLFFKAGLGIVLLYLLAGNLYAQSFPRTNIPNRGGGGQTQNVQYDRNGRPLPASAKQDSGFLKRDNFADSITINYRLFDSSRIMYFDSSLNDFTRRYPLAPSFYTLGNFGGAAQSLLFKPFMAPGWDAGFHAFDPYRLTVQDTRFYQTTRPYTELGYLLGSKSEQMINIVHTQNVRPNFNLGFQYRFINSPGSFKSQNTNHNSFRINGNYVSSNKRYSAYGIYITNKLLSSENGGVQFDSLLNDSRFTDRYLLPTRLGGDQLAGRNFFNTTINTGNLNRETILLYRHQYDLGQKDSLVVNDSTTYKLFYPRIRFQHTFTYSSRQYQYLDRVQYETKKADYLKYFGYTTLGDTLSFTDKWTEINNDFSIVSFPEKKNANQFLKVGAALQNLTGTFNTRTGNYYNISLNGEYRNRTRNQKWNLNANGQLYLVGLNNGDYALRLSLQRYLSKKLGAIEVGFQNVNRSPSFIYRSETSFPTTKPAGGFNKENITRLYASINNAQLGLKLNGEYFLMSNYLYFQQFLQARQEGTLFNVLHVSAEKVVRLSKLWSLFSEVHVQKETGAAPVSIPLVYTNNRINLEANLYKNLYLATGLELRYNTPFKAYNYSPLTGQYVFQDSATFANRPTINLFFDFNIKSFKAYVRVENINALNVSGNNIGFTAENLNAPHYPERGLWVRVGIWWTFIN